MLSIVDIKKELGTNIYIYPVHSDSIKANSIDLHLSRFGWSISTKKPLDEKDGALIIPKHDTALVYSEESIYVSNKIGGDFHSKVTLVSLGLGHIGTALDATYVGNCLIALHNHSNFDIPLQIGAEFVTVHLHYLHSPGYINNNMKFPGHPRMLNGYDEESVRKYINWRDQNTWNTDERILYHKMIESDSYKVCKQEYEKELETFTRNKIKKSIKRVSLLCGILVLIAAVLAIPAYWVNLGKASSVIATICEKLIYPVFAGIAGAYITKQFIEK